MKLVVFGATGGIGSQVVEQALAAGHTVTAVARRPEAVKIQHKELTAVRGDVLEPATVVEAITGNNVVVSAIGVTSHDKTTLYSAGIANIMQAMQENSVHRLLCVSASGLVTGPGTPLLERLMTTLVLQRIFHNRYDDLRRMEAALETSELDWTVVRAPRLLDGSRRRRYQIGINKHLSQRGVTRADVADYIVTHLDDAASTHARIELAY